MILPCRTCHVIVFLGNGFQEKTECVHDHNTFFLVYGKKLQANCIFMMLVRRRRGLRGGLRALGGRSRRS